MVGQVSDQEDSASWFDAPDGVAGPSTPPKYDTRARQRQGSVFSPSPELPASPGAFPSEPFFSADAAERFKYIIYSSQLLDKDWAPRPEASTEQPPPPTEAPVEEPLLTPDPVPAGRNLEELARLCLHRWDIALAALCGLIGATLLAGWSWTLPATVVLGTAGLWVLPPHTIQRHQPAIKGGHDTSFIEKASSSTDIRPRGPNELISNLEAFLSSCRKLDTTLATALDRIPRSAPISVHRALRLAIHQHTVDMTDSLASATSSLLTLVDRKELALLGEMYDVPLGMIQTGIVRPPVFSPAIPSPKRAIPQAATASPLRELKTRSLARPASARLSLAPSRPFSADDRFTAMPERTPRISKRMSWDNPAYGSPRPDSPRSDWAMRRRSLRLSQRRIDEVDGESSSSGTSADRSTSATSPSLAPVDASPRLPSTPGLESAKYSETSSRQNSPEASIHRPGTPNQFRTDFIQDRTLLPSPMSRDKSKRRSLQSLPYSSGSESMRPRDSPLVEQPTRPGHAKRKSLHNLPYSPGGGLPWRPDSPTLQELRSGGQGSPSASSPARSLRAESDPISPLTLSALKAACLGLHLKRRRLACCLLGIDLARHRASVSEVLADLGATMDMEREVLVGSMTSEEQKVATPPLPQPQWPDGPSAFEKHDFAPTTSTTERMADSVYAIRKAMEGAWERSDAVLAGRDTTAAWTAIRDDLGEMIRAWERGREALPDMARKERAPLAPSVGTVIQPPITESEDLPAFMKAWDEGSPPPTPPELEHGSDTTAVETLPAPGVDAVYEADVAAQTRANPLEGLSRDERIRLNREARAKGMTLKEYIQGDQTQDERQDKAHAAAESMVVDELKGMIDVIRQKKTRMESSL